jgi:LmbE family N-acetylglucosaminyl deacetylase
MALDPRPLTAAEILVVAPHPDDESLGCGGLISVLAAAGRRFHTIFVTDGGASHPNSRAWPRGRVTAQREQEAGEALRQLGVGHHPRTFLRLRDARMPIAPSPARRSALARVSKILHTFRPGIVLLPWRRDPHCDHRHSWELLKEAIAGTTIRPMTLEYTIWLNELGCPGDYPHATEVERLDFDIAGAIPNKRAAIAAHLSQTTNMIDDDPTGFRLTSATIERLTGPKETYWRPLS